MHRQEQEKWENTLENKITQMQKNGTKIQTGIQIINTFTSVGT